LHPASAVVVTTRLAEVSRQGSSASRAGVTARYGRADRHGSRRQAVVEDLIDDRRAEPPFVLPEREMLEEWLEFHRITLLMKCEGLSDADRKHRWIPTSKLSLHGLVRHMADVERNWFVRVLLREPDTDYYFVDEGEDDSELVPLDDAVWEDDVEVWREACNSSRTAASHKQLDDTGIRRGEPCTLRWIYVHMIEEYARHNGHADLLRELADGAVGW
jgi:uncharacterized damage-inducible protein DinB